MEQPTLARHTKRIKAFHQTIQTIVRYWSKVDVRAPNECWPWLAGTNAQGYGLFSVGMQQFRASRFGYWVHTGVYPGDRMVCHSCDNPPCQNPAHLFLGTALENSQDKIKKGRFRTTSPKVHGEQNGRAKLDDASVRYVLASYATGCVTQQALADELGVADTTIWKIIRRKSWTHVNVTEVRSDLS